MKKCTNCKHEPIWGPPVGSKEYRRRPGKCLWPGEIHAMPDSYTINGPATNFVYDDGSLEYGYGGCKTWEPKEE